MELLLPQQSAEQTELVKAWIAFKNDLGTIQRDSKGNRSTYVKIDGVVESCDPHLTAHGLMVTQDFLILKVQEQLHRVLRTTIKHASSDQFRESYFLLPDIQPGSTSNDNHAIAGSITYFRRYCFLTMIFGATGDDVDGEVEYRSTPVTISKLESDKIQAALELYDTQDKIDLVKTLCKQFGIKHLGDLPKDRFAKCMELIELPQ